MSDKNEKKGFALHKGICGVYGLNYPRPTALRQRGCVPPRKARYRLCKQVPLLFAVADNDGKDDSRFG